MTQKIYIIFAFILLAIGGYIFFNFRDTTIGPIQSHRSYVLEVVSLYTNLQPNTPTALVYRIKNERGEILKNFETVHEKIMHLIVVREDLQNFEHLHPIFNSTTGEFSITIIFPTDGPYRIFPDFTPAQNADNPQLLPVTLSQDITVGDTKNYKAQPVVVDTKMTKIVEDYQILFIAPKELQTQTLITYSLNVKKNAKDVTNLELYLGALGHSVILRADTLDFIHTHAESGMNMSSAEHDSMDKSTMEYSGPDISFRTAFPQSGLYKIFVQFQHEKKVRTIDFVVDVKN